MRDVWESKDTSSISRLISDNNDASYHPSMKNCGNTVYSRDNLYWSRVPAVAIFPTDPPKDPAPI